MLINPLLIKQVRISKSILYCEGGRLVATPYLKTNMFLDFGCFKVPETAIDHAQNL